MRKFSSLLLALALLPAVTLAQTSGPNGGAGGTSTTSTTYSKTNATGTDTVTFTATNNYQWYTLAASTNETFTLSDARAPASGTFDRDVLKVCQPASGANGDTETFTNTELASGTSGTTSSGWSNETQRGYTMILTRCDIYCFDWDGTSFHDCGFLANVAP